MRNMFYNYDNNIPNNSSKSYPNNGKYPKEINKQANSFHGAKLLKDKKGNVLGIEATRNSIFRLFFSLEGVVNTGTIQDLLENTDVFFEILDVNHNVLLECDVEIFSLYNMVSVEIIATEDGPLTGGHNYKMHLYTILDGITYDLFSENNGVLYIK